MLENFLNTRGFDLSMVYWLFILIGVLLLYYFYIFRRDPVRNIPKNGIVSPANGKVIQIVKTSNLDDIEIKKGLIGKIKTICKEVAKECTIISIMMTPLNVHFQRAPIDGKILSIKYSPGKFMNAVTTQTLDTLENEKNEILIKKGNLKLKVIQIAGFACRRINCFVEKGQKITKGQKIGFIDLGSQVVLILPKSFKVKVKKGQKVIEGETIIAHGKN